MFKCNYCNVEFNNINGQQFGAHKTNCQKNPDRNKTISKIKETSRKKKIEYRFECKKCNLPYSLTITKTAFDNNKYTKFCSRKCANSRIRSEDTKNKIAYAHQLRNGIFGPFSIFNYCRYCTKTIKNSNRNFCNSFCRTGKNRDLKSDKEKYYNLCKFRFSIKDYPDLFNDNIIKENGWYKCDGKNNNLEGVSRDHKISVSYGFKNGILPYYISHHLNCELMKHSDNKKKHGQCSLTIEELIDNISG